MEDITPVGLPNPSLLAGALICAQFTASSATRNNIDREGPA